MRIVAGFICAFFLFAGAPSLAADQYPPPPKEKRTKKQGKEKAAKEKGPVKPKKTYALSLTPTAGWYFFSGKDNLKSGPMYGARLSCDFIGSQMVDSLGLDAVFGVVDTTSSIDNSKAKVYHFRLDASYPFIIKNSDFTPFLAIGAGGNVYEGGDSGAKGLFGYGGGLKYKILDYLAARADVRHIILFSPERHDNVELTAGLTYTFGVERKPKPAPPEKEKKDKEKGDKAGKDKEGKDKGAGEKKETAQATATPREKKGTEAGVKAPEGDRKTVGHESPTPVKGSVSAAPAQPGAGQASVTGTKPVVGGEAKPEGGGTAAQNKAVMSAAAPGASGQDPTASGEKNGAVVPAEGGAAKVAVVPAAQSRTAKVEPEGGGRLPEVPRKIEQEAAAAPPERRIDLTGIAPAGNGVEIRTSAPVETFRYFREAKQGRLVIELPEAQNGIGKDAVPLGALGIAGARIDASQGTVRIVFDADWQSFQRFRVEKTGNGLKVSLVESGDKSGTAAVPQESEKAPASVPAPAGHPSAGPVQQQEKAVATGAREISQETKAIPPATAPTGTKGVGSEAAKNAGPATAASSSPTPAAPANGAATLPEKQREGETKGAPVAPSQTETTPPPNKSTPAEAEKEKTSSPVPTGKEAATSSPADEGALGTATPAIGTVSGREAVPQSSDSSAQLPAVKASRKASDEKAPATVGRTDVKKGSDTGGGAVPSAAAPASPGAARMEAPRAGMVAKTEPQLTGEGSPARAAVISDSSSASETVQPAPAAPLPAGKVEPAIAPKGPSDKETGSPADSTMAVVEPAVTAVVAAGNGLEIATSAPVEGFSYSTKSAPARLVIYLLGFGKNESGKDSIPLGVMGIAGARVDALQGKVRIVLDADRESFPPFRVEAGEKGLRVSLVEAGQPGGTPAVSVSRERASVPVAPAAPPDEKAPQVPSATQEGTTAPEPHSSPGVEAPPARGEADPGAKEFFRFTVRFDTARADLRPGYYGMLRKAIAFMKTHPGTVAEIRGHADSIGKAPYNMRLSLKRAAAVKKYLVRKAGIDASRIVVRGYGFYFPVADNVTAAGRQKNRRTEVTIVVKQGEEVAAAQVGARAR